MRVCLYWDWTAGDRGRTGSSHRARSPSLCDSGCEASASCVLKDKQRQKRASKHSRGSDCIGMTHLAPGCILKYARHSLGSVKTHCGCVLMICDICLPRFSLLSATSRLCDLPLCTCFMIVHPRRLTH